MHGTILSATGSLRFLASGNYHILADSVAVNTGTSLLADVPLDRDDVSRPQGAAYDMGAYEYVPSATSTNVTSSVNPTTYGVSTLLTATVTPSDARGTFTFKDGVTTIGTATVGQGSGSITVSNLAAGAHSLTAVYGGDSSYTTSTSDPVTQTVNQASTSSTPGAGGAANYWRRLYENGLAPPDFGQWWEDGGQTSSSSSASFVSSSSSSSSSSNPYRLLQTSQASSSSAASEGASSSSGPPAQSPSRTERICARVDRWIPLNSPRRATVLRRLLKWLGIRCGK